MRTFIRSSLFVFLTGFIGGCSSNVATRPAASSATQPDTKAFLMPSAGVNVLKLTTSTDMKCVTADRSLHFTAPQYEVEFWVVSGAKSVDDAVGSVSTQIVSEFKDFKTEHQSDLIIAGLPAKRLVGTGHEADDGDPGDADVIVFKVGDHVFIACTHGESLIPVAQQGMLSLARTAQAP